MLYFEEARKKINEGKKDVKGQKEGAMKNSVADALITFCAQDDVLAKEIVDGGTFADCMKAVAKGVGSSISDLEAYKKAVKFYSPSAEVGFAMTIQRTADSDSVMSAGTEVEKTEHMAQEGRKIIDLSAFF